MFRGLGAGDVLECWFPILPIIRLDVFFGPKAIYQEPLKVLSEANKGSTVKEPVWGLQWTWETTDVLNVAGNLPLCPQTHTHTPPQKKQAACALMERCFCIDSVRNPTSSKTTCLPSTFRGRCKEKAVKLLQRIFLSPPVLIGVSVKPHWAPLWVVFCILKTDQ